MTSGTAMRGDNVTDANVTIDAMSARAKSPAAATRPATKERCGSPTDPERSEWVHEEIRGRRV